MLTEAYGQEDAPYGQFVSHGILQIKRLAMYRIILKAKNKFIDNHTVMVIRGMSAEAFATEFITEHSKSKKIENYLEEDLGIESFEQSNMTLTEGK
eukprot:6157713-Ditylum_brightwellii.AAC.1